MTDPAAVTTWATGHGVREIFANVPPWHKGPVTIDHAVKFLADKRQWNRENGKGTSVVENPDGTLSKVDRSTEVVEVRKQMNTFEEVNRKADNNPNRPYPPEWGTPDWRQWPDE